MKQHKQHSGPAPHTPKRRTEADGPHGVRSSRHGKPDHPIMIDTPAGKFSGRRDSRGFFWVPVDNAS